MEKVYLITGATSDLSSAFLKKLDEQMHAQKETCIVYGIYYKSMDSINDIKNNLHHVEIRSIQCDLEREEDIQRLIDTIRIDRKIPGHFIHIAAAKIKYMRLSAFEWEIAKQELDIQVGAFTKICRWLLPEMAKKRFGRIITIGSSCTIGTPPKFMSDYILTKYALLGATKAIASEYGGKGVTCNMVSPDMMETKFLSELDKRTVEINATQSEMKRNVTVEEVAESILYLNSDLAGYLNGINLNISGGRFM